MEAVGLIVWPKRPWKLPNIPRLLCSVPLGECGSQAGPAWLLLPPEVDIKLQTSIRGFMAEGVSLEFSVADSKELISAGENRQYLEATCKAGSVQQEAA